MGLALSRKLIKYYVLDKDCIPQEATLEEWAEFFEKDDRFIARYERDGYLVSTVFLGLDHNWSGKGPPVLFETMVFSDDRANLVCDLGSEMDSERSCTKDDALIVHERKVKELDRKLDYSRDVALAICSGTKEQE